MRRTAEAIVLGLSACGYPLAQLAVRHWGMRGVAVAESVCAGLAIRDASMVASGVPDRLHPVPAALLRLELAASVVAGLAGSRHGQTPLTLCGVRLLPRCSRSIPSGSASTCAQIGAGGRRSLS